MSVSFDWEFEQGPHPSRRPGAGAALFDRRRRRLRRIVILLALLAALGLATYLWVAGRLRAIEKIKAELRATVELEFKTIVKGDTELFRLHQDPRDHRWQDRQAQRYVSPQADQFVPAPGLTPAARPPEIKAVHLFGRNARVELIRWFDPPIENPAAVPFHLTWFYRQDDSGTWHHVAPPDGYWGPPYARSYHYALTTGVENSNAPAPDSRAAVAMVEVLTGPMLQINATQTEAKPIDFLDRGLGNLLAEGCRLLNCPAGARYSLSFQDIPAPQLRGRRWALPALYHTGTPANRKAQIAWQRALRVWLVETLAFSQVGRQHLTDRIIFRQLVTHLQVRLGLLEAPPLDRETLSQALAEGRTHSLQSLWHARYDSHTSQQLRFLEIEVTALLQVLEAKVGPERLFELLPALREYGWIDLVLADVYGIDPDAFKAAWTAHLSNLAGAADQP